MVCVDHDPVVRVHNTALLATDDRVVSVQADIRQPQAILEHPAVARLIDFGQPAGLLCVAVPHLVPDDDDPEGIIAQYRDRVRAGSHLVLSQFGSDGDPDAMGELRAVAAGTPVETYFRPRHRIRRVLRRFRTAAARPDRCPGVAAGRHRSHPAEDRRAVGRKP